MSELFKNPNNKSIINFEDLFQIIHNKIISDEEKSYTKKLVKGDITRLLQKIGEEGVEVTIASIIYDKDNSTKARQDLINEVCDLFYHNLVLLARNDIKLKEIFTELHNRNKNYE